MVYFLCKVYDSDRQNCYFAQSLPVRGAWIEIMVVSLSGSSPAKSLPVRGAWIEMATSARFSSVSARRSPCGERGLKSAQARDSRRGLLSLPVRGAWIEIFGTADVTDTEKVAPRAGSVD